MTEWSDAEISRRLALAIGWQQVVTVDGTVAVPCDDYWKEFDYRDPAVIWPIAARFDCFPVLDQYAQWVAGKYPYQTADTAAKAVAIAVIKSKEQE